MKLLLMHGRANPDEDINQFGFAGPTLRSVAHVHDTYGTLRVGFRDREATELAHALTGWSFFADNVLEVRRHEDMIHATATIGIRLESSYYGDWELVDDTHAVGEL